MVTVSGRSSLAVTCYNHVIDKTVSLNSPSLSQSDVAHSEPPFLDGALPTEHDSYSITPWGRGKLEMVAELGPRISQTIT